MAGITGTALYVSFAGTELTQDYRSFGDSEEIGTVDQSAGSDTARTYLTTLTDGNASLTTVFQASGSAIWDAVVPGTAGTLIWAPEGTATGKSRHTVNSAIVTSREKSMEYADLVVMDVSFQFSAAVTDDVYP